MLSNQSFCFHCVFSINLHYQQRIRPRDKATALRTVVVRARARVCFAAFAPEPLENHRPPGISPPSPPPQHQLFVPCLRVKG